MTRTESEMAKTEELAPTNYKTYACPAHCKQDEKTNSKLGKIMAIKRIARPS